MLGITTARSAPTAVALASPVLAIAGSLVAGAGLAVAFILLLAPGGSEPLITGSLLLAFGLGWGLMAALSTRFTAQPQGWAAVPALGLSLTGLGLIVVQPGPGAMDTLGWIWPPALAVLAGWMVVQVRHELTGRGRWLIVPVIAALSVFAIGGALTTVSTATSSGPAASAAGRMVDVGGRALYIECTGSGSPVVVLQSGLAESSTYWSRIAPTIAASTTVCAYDRAGHGRSDEASAPQDGTAIAADLHTLLERAELTGPFVLAAHSSGGPYTQVFATRYPESVAGVVFLDAQPAEAFTALPDYPATYRTLQLMYGLSPSLARIGILGPVLGLPADQSTVAAARNARDELGILPTALQQAQGLTSLGDRPLIVVTAGTGSQAGWLAAHERMAALSTDSAQRIVEAASHSSLITGHEADASSQAILDVIAAVREGSAVR